MSVRLRECLAAPGTGHKYQVRYTLVKDSGEQLQWDKTESLKDITMRIKDGDKWQIWKDSVNMWVSITEDIFNQYMEG